MFANSSLHSSIFLYFHISTASISGRIPFENTFYNIYFNNKNINLNFI